MNRKWIVIAVLLTVTGTFAMPVVEKWGARHEVVLDRAMRAKTIDTLAAKLNDHYVFPDKAEQFGAILRQREQEGKYDGIRTATGWQSGSRPTCMVSPGTCI